MIEFTVIEGDFNKGDASYDPNLSEFYFFIDKALIALKDLISIAIVQNKEIVTFTLAFSDGKKALCQSSNNDYLRLKYIFDNKLGQTFSENKKVDVTHKEKIVVKKKKRIGFFWMVAIFLLIMVMIGALAGLVGNSISSNSSSSVNNGFSPTDIAMACRDYAKDSINTPSTADFQNIADQSSAVRSIGKVRGIPEYSLNSFMDAQNNFGATVRINFYCKVAYVGGDNPYMLVNLNQI